MKAPRRCRRFRIRALLLALGVTGWLLPDAPSAFAADLRSVEATGAVAIDPDDPPRRPPRDAALRAALAEAVWQVALAELPAFDPRRDEELLEGALGGDPLVFAMRYKIVENRGEGPAQILEGAKREYVVVVQEDVDAERVRRRLVERGLLTPRPSGDSGGRRVRIVLEDVESYGTYRAVLTVLEELGVRVAVPVEMERGRAVLEVDGNRSPERLLRALVRAAPPNLSLVPLESGSETLRLRARFQAGGGPGRTR